MDIYKQASKLKLRFQTSKGLLSVEQLWDLSTTELDVLAVQLDEEHKKSGKKSFLVKSSAKDKTSKLMFDLALDILTTKVEEQDAKTQELEDKKHNEKIINLIAEKQEDALKGKSVAELKAMLR